MISRYEFYIYGIDGQMTIVGEAKNRAVGKLWSVSWLRLVRQ